MPSELASLTFRPYRPRGLAPDLCSATQTKDLRFQEPEIGLNSDVHFADTKKKPLPDGRGLVRSRPNHEADPRNPASLALALYCGIGSSCLKADVKALDKLHIVREANSPP
jgi:hypothetical protein